MNGKTVLLSILSVWAEPNVWKSHGPEGAYIRAIVIDPQNPVTLYAAADFAGVVKSSDGGAHWGSVNSGLTRPYVNVLAIDPTASGTLYAGIDYGGVFKTTDGGASWTAVNSGLPSGTQVVSLRIDPRHPSTIYEGTYGGLFKSVDGGASWSALGIEPHRTNTYALVIDPENPATVYYYCVIHCGWARGIVHGRYCEGEMSVVRAKIQTVEDMYRLLWAAIANKQPISAIYKDRPRLFCPHRLGRNRQGEGRVLGYQYGGESESGLAPSGSPENWRCVVFQNSGR
jgi:photosystem II stability/assembly factor-like uncharacterized protein